MFKLVLSAGVTFDNVVEQQTIGLLLSDGHIKICQLLIA